MKKLMFCFGTRPEAIKLAPLIKLAQKSGNRVIIVHSGQHHEMILPFLELFELTPDHLLQVMKPNQSLSELSANILTKLAPILKLESPDMVFVQGDTTTALCSALAAFYEKIDVAHVEAGLRTFDPLSPFPEEMNRKIIGSIASYHFAPTQNSAENLKREGISKNIFVTGNTGIDALRLMSEKIKDQTSLSSESAVKKILVTCHRRENHGKPLESICKAIVRLAKEFPAVEFEFPVHMNPNVKSFVHQTLGNISNIHLVEPMDYFSFTKAMQESYLLLTDSGGIQEEAPYLKKPIFVLRESTERQEGVEAGVSTLVGSDEEAIYGSVKKALLDPSYYASFQKNENPYGDGHASEKILAALKM